MREAPTATGVAAGAHSIRRSALRFALLMYWEPMTGSLAGGFAANRGPDSIPVTGSPLRSEPMTGIEPALPAWEAGALPLSYIGSFRTKCGRPHHIGEHLRQTLSVTLSDHDCRT